MPLPPPTKETPIRLVLVEDHADFRESVSMVLEKRGGYQCVGGFSTMEDALEAFRAGLKTDLVLSDLGLPGMSGIDSLDDEALWAADRAFLDSQASGDSTARSVRAAISAYVQYAEVSASRRRRRVLPLVTMAQVESGEALRNSWASWCGDFRRAPEP